MGGAGLPTQFQRPPGGQERETGSQPQSDRLLETQLRLVLAWALDGIVAGDSSNISDSESEHRLAAGACFPSRRCLSPPSPYPCHLPPFLSLWFQAPKHKTKSQGALVSVSESRSFRDFSPDPVLIQPSACELRMLYVLKWLEKVKRIIIFGGTWKLHEIHMLVSTNSFTGMRHAVPILSFLGWLQILPGSFQERRPLT